MREDSKFTAKLCKLIRILSVPPVMAGIMVFLLYKNLYATTAKEILTLIISLCVMPVMAYPVSYIVPQLRKKGRNTQRNLAFIFTVAGYLCGFAYLFISYIKNDNAGKFAVYIQSVYLLSVIILIIFNGLIKLRASGHACSVTGPLVMSAICYGIYGIIAGVAIYMLVLIASVRIKRHSVKEFLLGTFSCVLAYIIGFVLFYGDF